MERNKYNTESRGAGLGWAALMAGVVVYDTMANETLSNGFRRGTESENPVIKASVYAGLGTVALHLLDILPERFDPVDNVANSLGRLGTRLNRFPLNNGRKL